MYKKIISWLSIQRKGHYILILLLGLLTGLLFTIIYVSNAFSYLSDRPETCVNCHVMTSEYSTWFHSSHRNAAVCNDCHVPHDNLIKKFYFKATDGLRHATYFTFRLEPQVMILGDPGKKVVQENCIRCHEHQISRIYNFDSTRKENDIGSEMLCWNCHRQTPHGRVHSQTATPFSIVPTKIK